MNPEDRLRDLLRNEASRVVPAGDGLAKIQQRLVRRRRRRGIFLPSAALAMAGVVSAFFVLVGSSGTQKLVQTPGTHRPSPSFFCYPPLGEGPCPTASPPPSSGQPIAPFDGPALWPFTSAEQAQAWTKDHGSRPWAADGVNVAQRFITDFLGLSAV